VNLTKNLRQLQPNDSSKDSPEDIILRTSRLFLRNLAFSCTDADLSELFKPFGDVSQVSHTVQCYVRCDRGSIHGEDDKLNRDIRLHQSMLIQLEYR
jgi:RNA recognition motif-containing protein